MMNIIFIFVIVVYTVCNTIQAIMAVKDNESFKEMLDNSQDTKIGKVLMTIFYLPVLAFLKIRSLRHVNTSFSFEENGGN